MRVAYHQPTHLSLWSNCDDKRDYGLETALKQFRSITLKCSRLDQHTARTKPESPLRCVHRCELSASARFPRILVRKFEKTEPKRFRSDAQADASLRSVRRRSGKVANG